MVLTFTTQQPPAVIFSAYRVFLHKYSVNLQQNNAYQNYSQEARISFMKLLTLSQVQVLDSDLERRHS